MIDYPVCKTCAYFQVVHDISDDRRAIKVALCRRFVDPILGLPLVAQVARQEDRMCGLLGAGYEKKEEEAEKSVIVSESA